MEPVFHERSHMALQSSLLAYPILPHQGLFAASGSLLIGIRNCCSEAWLWFAMPSGHPCGNPLCVGIGLVALLTLNQLSIPSLLQVRTWSSDLLIQFSATLDWRSTQSDLIGLVTITVLLLWVLRFRKLDSPQPYPEDPERLWVRDSFSPVMKWLLLAGTCLWVGLITLFPLVDFLGSISHWKASIAAISAGQRAVSTSLMMAAFTASFGLFLDGP